MRQVPFSCFVRTESFLAVPRATGYVFTFCATGLVFGGTDGVRSCFHVLHSRTSFLSRRVRRIPNSCFAPDSFSVKTMVSGPVFMFCAARVVSRGNEGVGSRFQVLRARTHFQRYRGRRLPFSCFVPPDSFRRYRGRSLPFSYFAPPNSFSAVPRASGPVFNFCVPGLFFSDIEVVDSRFHVLCPLTHFDGTEGVRSRFHILRLRTHFSRYRGRQVPFSIFACQDSFSAVTRASAAVFMF
jgi:hypothetical protein